jgi:hypothetical protein
MGRVPSTRQLALLAVSLTAWDDETDDAVGYEEALAIHSCECFGD